MKGTVSRSKSKSCGDRFDMLPSPFSLSRLDHKQFRRGANSHRKVQSGHFLACIQQRFIAWQIECVSVCVFVPSSVSVTGLIWDNPYNSALCQGWGGDIEQGDKKKHSRRTTEVQTKGWPIYLCTPSVDSLTFLFSTSRREGRDKEKELERGRRLGERCCYLRLVLRWILLMSY